MRERRGANKRHDCAILHLHGAARREYKGPMKILLAISALLAWAIGAMLVFAPAKFMAGNGIAIDDRIATIAQAQGVILIGLGLVNWLVRKSDDLVALRAVLAANLFVQVASIAVNVHALALHLVSESAAGTVVMHAILGAAFAIFLVRARRT